MEPWQLARLKEKVEKMAGRLEVKIFAADGTTYKIWYNPQDDVALYARMVWNNDKGRERADKAWSSEIAAATARAGAKIEVRVGNGKKRSSWFGPEPDMEPIAGAYKHIIGLIEESASGSKSAHPHK